MGAHLLAAKRLVHQVGDSKGASTGATVLSRTYRRTASLGAGIAAALLAASCGQPVAEFSGDGILRVELVFCDASPPTPDKCRPRYLKHPPRVSVVVRAIDGHAHGLQAPIDFSTRNGNPGTGVYSIAPGRYRATIRPRMLYGLIATDATATVTDGSRTTITLAYAPRGTDGRQAAG
jgi:hypothetical protein